MSEDEDLQIAALREELMKEVESVRGDVKSLKTGQAIIITLFGVFITLCAFIVAVLAYASDLF